MDRIDLQAGSADATAQTNVRRLSKLFEKGLAVIDLPLALVLLVAAVLRTWRLSQNGYGREYYAAGVRSMMSDWHNFFFNSFDPAGFVSLDKPPIAIWLQVLSAKVFGFSALAGLLPQVIEGVVSVWLVYLIVRRPFGRGAGLLAALLLALTPISVAVDRSNNTDSCLVVVLLLASWAAMRAAEKGRLDLLCLSMALVGLGFNVKMGAALVIAPALSLTYVVMGPRNFIRQRLVHVVLAGLLMLAVSVAWVGTYDLIPADSRPYVGSTTRNSMLELTVLHNGLERFIPRAQADGAVQANPAPVANGTAAGGRRRGGRGGFERTPAGPLRLFVPNMAAQAGWWLPLAAAGLILGWRSTGQAADDRARHIALAVWGGWLTIYWIVFSFAGGTFLIYYLAALSPALAALAGIGAWELLRKDSSLGQTAKAALITCTALWQSYLVIGEVGLDVQNEVVWLLAVAMAITLVSTALTRVHAPWLRQFASPYALLAVSLAALVIMPITSALSVVLVRPNVSIPSADLTAYSRPPRDDWQRSPLASAAAREKLGSYLLGQRHDERFLAAASSSRVAAPLIVDTGAPVMAMGGFAGRDPILTPADLQHLVTSRQLRFVLIDENAQAAGGRRNQPPSANQTALNDWVRANGKKVDPDLWQVKPMAESDLGQTGGRPRPARSIELFDMRG